METSDKIRCQWAESNPLLRDYHDAEYGFPLTDDNALFERLVLEQMQAGLSWLTILRKRASFRIAFRNFDVATVASFTQKDLDHLLHDSGIVRNRKKIEAAIENAKRIKQLQSQGVSFHRWLEIQHADKPSLEEWMKRFKAMFVFTGREIVNEFLMSTGYLPVMHQPDCWLVKSSD